MLTGILAWKERAAERLMQSSPPSSETLVTLPAGAAVSSAAYAGTAHRETSSAAAVHTDSSRLCRDRSFFIGVTFLFLLWNFARGLAMQGIK